MLYTRELFSFENILKIILWKTLEGSNFKLDNKIINNFILKNLILQT